MHAEFSRGVIKHKFTYASPTGLHPLSSQDCSSPSRKPVFTALSLFASFCLLIRMITASALTISKHFLFQHPLFSFIVMVGPAYEYTSFRRNDTEGLAQESPESGCSGDFPHLIRIKNFACDHCTPLHPFPPALPCPPILHRDTSH